MTYVPNIRPVTPKPDGFRTPDVEQPKRLNNSSKKNYEVKLTIHYLLASFGTNTHCIMRQEVRLLNEFFFLFFLFFEIYSVPTSSI
jgi:hypothetical protein